MSSATMNQHILKKEIATHIKTVDVSRGEISFLATHRQIDRTGEVVEPEGVSLASFEKIRSCLNTMTRNVLWDEWSRSPCKPSMVPPA